jgi:hypothetical protein
MVPIFYGTNQYMAPPTPSSSTMGIFFSILLELSNLLGLVGKEVASLLWISQSILASRTLRKVWQKPMTCDMINQITLTTNC